VGAGVLRCPLALGALGLNDSQDVSRDNTRSYSSDSTVII